MAPLDLALPDKVSLPGRQGHTSPRANGSAGISARRRKPGNAASGLGRQFRSLAAFRRHHRCPRKPSGQELFGSQARYLREFPLPVRSPVPVQPHDRTPGPCHRAFPPAPKVRRHGGQPGFCSAFPLLAFSKNFKRGPSGEEGLIRAWDTAWKSMWKFKCCSGRAAIKPRNRGETDGAPRHEGPGLHAEGMTQSR